MQVHRQDGVVSVGASAYSLLLVADRPFVYLLDPAGERIAELFVLSSVHTLGGRDDTTRIEPWQVEERGDEVVCSLRADSSLWRSKTYRLRCLPTRFAYEIELEGEGELAEAHYFGGYYSGQTRWGSGFFWSGQHFTRGFNPEPNMLERNYFAPEGGSVIDIMGVPLPGRGDWFFTPAPFCYAFEYARGWLSMGVEARAGENRFTQFLYHAQFGFYLTLSYEGHTRVRGRHQLPALVIDFGADEFAVLTAHAARVRALSNLRERAAEAEPHWWYEPIWCGWGAQCYVEAVEKRYAYFFARQDLYEKFLGALDANGVNPGIVVLDDKWQATYGENRADETKWPDLRGFIAQQHARGRKVLLWLKAWSPEGLPDDECISNAAGLPLALDPTNPKLERRLRESVRHMLGADGYDADGFKLDFTARIPSGPGLRKHGDAWGLELMKKYLGILYDEAKRAKPDALVMTHTPHPYLADVVDMIRLNDMNRNSDILQAMRHRARIAALACPDAIIDCDNWPVSDKETWRAYLRIQPELGVPSLYYATHIDATQEPLSADDYALIRETWARYRAARAEGRRA